MKTAAVFALLVAFVGATALVEPLQGSGYPDCGLTDGSFYIPEKITVGKPFAVRFCSGAYFKTSSKSITLAIGFNSTSVDGSVILTQDIYPVGGKKYDFEATVPNSLDKFSDKSPLIVVEKINGYYESEYYQVTTKKAHIVYPEESYAGDTDAQVLISANLD
ncbi:uncharacterized protein SCHCODRAFT_02502252 [Schizophyllum commune H4-8]|nr:uncharacterized protein SCHCODRAFT_02502252 [Schizophyllum commune H4-8]KAI5892420.1 hypothetical protein SCHCODRAFT_02502252 [Schizophyllum commune H4-8]